MMVSIFGQILLERLFLQSPIRDLLFIRKIHGLSTCDLDSCHAFPLFHS